jgi:hypothetical protein
MDDRALAIPLKRVIIDLLRHFYECERAAPSIEKRHREILQWGRLGLRILPAMSWSRLSIMLNRCSD